MWKFKKPNLLILIIFAIFTGIACGWFFPEPLSRLFLTFNSIFGNFLGFCIPLIIIGFVTPSIADMGGNAGKMLLTTVALAYFITISAGLLSYGVSAAIFPSMISESNGIETLDKAGELTPFFTINMPPLIDIMSALVLAFVIGIGITQVKTPHNILNCAPKVGQKRTENEI